MLLNTDKETLSSVGLKLSCVDPDFPITSTLQKAEVFCFLTPSLYFLRLKIKFGDMEENLVCSMS